ncbi:Pex19 protein family-domain-containing protein [Nemania sp. NC0429]|nr:Pex19 protein family-domain-containing protein [Nemania sp. NC0429]
MEAEKAGIPGDKSQQRDQTPGAELRPATEASTIVGAPRSDEDDPDEDDLDDLDDMLDDFSTIKLSAKTDTPTTTAAAPAAATTTTAAVATSDGVPDNTDEPLPGLDDFSEEEFQKQLQAGMAELIGDLEGSPDMQAQFESIFKGLAGTETAGLGDESAPASSSTAEAAAEDLGQDASFQETIRRTMARMQASGEQATAAATAEGSEDDFIAEMMKAMKDIPGGDGNEEDFSKLLMGMMEQLTNKEILYEPMKELNDKFPGWMEKNKDTIAKDDLKRYQEQQVLVSEMVTKFEESTYSDSNAADREYIVDRMQKMQAAGSPPPDLVGDLPTAKEVLDAPEDSCAQQ